MDTVKLNNGVEMPQMGYGVYQVSPAECERCVSDALKVGYRMIDTAQAYHNEEGVGNAVGKSGIDRKEIFLVSKVWISNYGYEKAKASIDESLRKLQTDYIDLMLLHQPFCDRYGAYRALEEAYKDGKLRAIGSFEFLSRPLYRPGQQRGDRAGGKSSGNARIRPTDRAAENHGGVRYAHHVVGTVRRRSQRFLYESAVGRNRRQIRQKRSSGRPAAGLSSAA